MELPTVTSEPPPPYCDACPGLPKEYYSRCVPCSTGKFYDGQYCVAKGLCPCYKDGIRYEIGAIFESSNCEECECVVGSEGHASCQEKKCPPCKGENEHSVLTPSCTCVCKPCPPKTKVCPSSNYCLNESSWCDNIEDCPDDELDCPTQPPPIPAGCPTKDCPDPWVLKVQETKNRCPIVTCELPPITTPMPCPIPHCPLQFDIVYTPKKPGEICPTYKCQPPITTMEPPTCPPPVCPDGYAVLENIDYYDQQSGWTEDWCPHYQCVPPVTPTAPCPPPACPQGYEVNYKDSKEMLEYCPEYDCSPIITTTMCPPVECPDDLRVMYIDNLEGSACPQYTCIQVTTPFPSTTETPFPQCPPAEIPICAAGETMYTTTEKDDPCPKFACKAPGIVPTTPPEELIIPVCRIVGRTITSFDDSSYQVDPCNHILAGDKVDKIWMISAHRNCSQDMHCDRYLKLNVEEKSMILRPDLRIEWDGQIYTTLQAQRIGKATNTFTISRVGDTLYYESKTYNFEVVWNTDMNIKIEVGKNLKNKVDGLCGLFNKDPKDDKTKPDGKLATSTAEFGKSWLFDGDSCEAIKCSSEHTSEAFQMCNMVQSKPFTECHKTINPSQFLKTCVDEVCQCLQKGGTEGECRCQALNRYVTSCLEINPAASLADWRIVAKCYKLCKPGEVYMDCFQGTCEKTCENLHDGESCPYLENICASGCFCAPGLVRKGDTCVSPDSCRDCVCEGYGDPHFKTFDRFNYTFNGKCSYIAARDKNIRGQHAFQVITRHKQCSDVPVTVCTDAITVLYDSHTLLISGEGEETKVTVDGKGIVTFPHKESWIALEQPDKSQVMAAIPDIEIEVAFFQENFGFSIKIPSHLYFNKTEGLCGNCNYDDSDDLVALNVGLEDSVESFGHSWLFEGEPSDCGVLHKDDRFCILPEPEEDPCLYIMNEDIFGQCHSIEEPAAYVSACQLDACGSSDPMETACHSMQAYARRCADLEICLDWRSDELCPKKCPKGLEYRPCGPGCVRTCDNYKDLDQNTYECLISPVDGCYCPNDEVLDGDICVNVSYCETCDAEGHRLGDTWQTDPCTTCECSKHGSSCSTKTCPGDPICDEGYIIVEMPDTGDECCGSRKKCKIAPVANCTLPTQSKDECGYGKMSELIEAPGKCPQYACVCVKPEDCPELIMPEEDLGPGEEWVLDESGCCPKYVTKCSGECPVEECPEFYSLITKSVKEDKCCPVTSCEPPSDACIYESTFEVNDAGFQRELTEDDETVKKLYKIGDTWEDGLCLKCKCVKHSQGTPRHQCSEQVCTSLEKHPDKGNFQLDVIEVGGQCCPSIIRTACIDDYEVIPVGDRLDDPVNGCRSVECIKTPEGRVDKVEQIFSCDESCPLGWNYEPSPLYPIQCCGACVQVACVIEDQVKNVGESWMSRDLCTTYTCTRDNKNQIQIQAVEVKCAEPSSKEREFYIYSISGSSDRCCSEYTREECLINEIPIRAGETVQDPSDPCTSIKCEIGVDGNVTRKEKETTCDSKCSLGHTYILPKPGSNECCGKCVHTHCVEDGITHSIGEQWSSEGDKCYEYSCESRNDVLTTVALKRDCPYFDPECPEEEIYMDDEGCCKLCRIKRPVKSDCKPNAMPPEETVGIFVLKARGVGTCKNPNPVIGLNRCAGHCDSYTQLASQGGGRAVYISSCFCCKPARYEKILVDMRCDNGYSFTRTNDNVVECECLRCEDNLPEYQGDDPSAILEDSDFYELASQS
ncbi:hypothetical protein SK128_023902 [Halocaridina rubra]|uniref:Hemocytin n=1 Tax=Halocaridina rubra TaxID=373956 RepID=A0AAN8WMX6_HALRR